MNLIDFHCDTAAEILRGKCGIRSNDCHISLDKAAVFEHYAQVTACYQSKKLTDSEGWNNFFTMSDNLKSEVNKAGDFVEMITDGDRIPELWQKNKAAFILSVEDARILENDLSRLDILYERGVRILTILWGGATCIGGAHNTDDGLTDFGKAVVRRCFELGIIVDISHASEASADDVAALSLECGKLFIASHSCAYGVNPHSRNLRDRHIEAILRSGGIIGMSLCPPHLKKGGAADAETVVEHIEYYLSKGAADALCMGCDLDGTSLPDGFSDIRDLKKIEELLRQRGCKEDVIEKIFWRNALAFAQKNIK